MLRRPITTHQKKKEKEEAYNYKSFYEHHPKHPQFNFDLPCFILFFCSKMLVTVSLFYTNA
jgi:hypothetical protein